MREIVSARDAFDNGKKRYFSGKPCKYGHIAERMVSNGVCVECLSYRASIDPGAAYRKTKVWRDANPGARAEEARKYRAKHPDSVAKIQKKYREKNIEKIRFDDKERQKRIRNSDPEAQKERTRRFAEKKALEREALAGRPKPIVCEICGPLAIGRIVFDHCHTNGHFRGWICDRCNKVLGLMKDDQILLLGLAEYLKKTEGKK